MRREYGGAVPKAALSVALGGTGADLTIICDNLSGWLTGVGGPFFVIINRGKATEEKILVTSRTGNILAVSARAVDGTAISAHDIGEPIEHVFTATDADEANEHVNTGSGAHGYPAISDVVTLTGTQTLTNKTIDFDDNTMLNIPPGPTGPVGPIGPVGPASVTYQPTAPVAPFNGELWVDSDAIIPTEAYLPAGGDEGDILIKASITDYDVTWSTQGAATGGSYGASQWKYQTGVGEPGVGFLRYDTGTLTLSEMDAFGFTQGVGLALVASGDTITARDTNGALWFLEVTGAPTDNGTWWTIPATAVSGPEPPKNNQKVLLSFVTTSGGSSSVAYQPDAPVSPAIGDLWVDSDGVLPSGGGGSGTVSNGLVDIFLFGGM